MAKHKSQTYVNATKINGKKLKKAESAGLKKRKRLQFSAFGVGMRCLGTVLGISWNNYPCFWLGKGIVENPTEWRT
ncbi:hypothetical protein NST84_08830 [Paenibacillus sp. FSL R7-0345]|uniref:hypothetical protein n=1 Tax=Paenibacillus sp. FSL R7-0345 TaxID=2954535 RepID=UPI00315AEBB1